MVTLDRHINIPGVVSVCLPDPSHPVSLTRKLTVAGWGADKSHTKAKAVTQLQYAQLDTTPVADCQVVFSLLHSDWSRNVEDGFSLVERFIVLLRQLSYAIKNQLRHPNFLPYAGSLWNKGAYKRSFPCMEATYPFKP